MGCAKGYILQMFSFPVILRASDSYRCTFLNAIRAILHAILDAIRAILDETLRATRSLFRILERR